MNSNFRRNRRKREPDPYDGILLVDKPAEWTSHDVVAKVRNYFKFNKVGHGGTLDPMATGLLVLLIGRGTKLSNRIMGGNKVYEGVIRLGVTTSTQDRDGEVLNETDTSCITLEQVKATVANYIGDIHQVPPMVSAIKKNGVPLYKLARKGKEIKREPRLVHIFNFDVLDFENPFVRFRLKSSKGTYVRTLAHDIGQDLGVGGNLYELRRIASGNLCVDHAFTLDEILTWDRESFGKKIISVADFLMP